jgi:hypothetical protein
LFQAECPVRWQFSVLPYAGRSDAQFMKRCRNLGKGKRAPKIGPIGREFVMTNWSRLLSGTASLVVLGMMTVPTQSVAAPKLRIPATVPAVEEAPKPVVRTRVPAKLETDEPAKIENNPRIRNPVAAPSDEEAVRVDHAEVTPAPPVRVRKPRVDTSTPATLETSPKIRTRVPAPTEASPEVENTPRIRTRVATPDVKGEEQAPRRLYRPGDTQVGSALPVGIPGGTVHSIGSTQANCLFRPDANLNYRKKPPTPGSTAILEMVCIRAGVPTLTGFRYDVPTDKNTSSPLLQATQIDNEGLASLITYEIDPVETDQTGRQVYKLVSLAKGEDGRRTTYCIDPDEGLQRKAGFGDHDPGIVATFWCSDGTTISERSFQINNWLMPANTGKVSLGPPVSDSTQKPREYGSNTKVVQYEGSTGTSEAGPFLMRSIVGGGTTYATCKLNGTDAGSLYCTTDPINGVVTTYLAHSLPSVRAQIGKLSAPKCSSETAPVYDDKHWGYGGAGGQLSKYVRYYDVTTTVCHTRKIGYTLLPGKVAAQDRGKVKGACYLASWAGIVTEKSVTITYGRAVEVTKTGEQVINPADRYGPGGMEDVTKEGRTIGTNGTLDLNTALKSNGERVPLQNITKVNAPCT